MPLAALRRACSPGRPARPRAPRAALARRRGRPRRPGSTPRRSPLRARRSGRRSCTPRSTRRSTPRGAATSPTRAPGSSCASSGRRRASHARPPTATLALERLGDGTIDAGRCGDRCPQPTCSTRTTAGSARRWRRSPRPTASASTRAARRRARSSSATGGSSGRRTGRSAARANGGRPRPRSRRSRWRRARRRSRRRCDAEPRAASRGSARHRCRAEETLRRAGQLDRFLRLVSIEYGRGVSNGRVTKDFEIQEAITFRDGAAAAFADLEPRLLAIATAAATRRVKAALASLGASLVDRESRRDARAPSRPSTRRRRRPSTTCTALYPAEWKDAAKTADFDVIAAALDRHARLRPRAATGGRRSRRGSRRTASSSSVPSSVCAGSRRHSSRASSRCSGTAAAITTGSCG